MRILAYPAHAVAASTRAITDIRTGLFSCVPVLVPLCVLRPLVSDHNPGLAPFLANAESESLTLCVTTCTKREPEAALGNGIDAHRANQTISSTLRKVRLFLLPTAPFFPPFPTPQPFPTSHPRNWHARAMRLSPPSAASSPRGPWTARCHGARERHPRPRARAVGGAAPCVGPCVGRARYSRGRARAPRNEAGPAARPAGAYG